MNNICQKRYMLSIISGFILLTNSIIQADQRSYVWTYEYLTLERGEVEFENYITTSAPSFAGRNGSTSVEHQYEWEIGMTDRFDVAIYQVFKQNPESNFRYSGLKVRTKYRLGEKGKYPLDPLFYLEYKSYPDFSEPKIEGKLIFAKDIKRINISFNPIIEFEKEDSWKYEFEYAVGASYRISTLVRLGLEVKGSKTGVWYGPVIAHGREGAWVALGSAFLLGEKRNDLQGFQLRLLMGFNISD